MQPAPKRSNKRRSEGARASGGSAEDLRPFGNDCRPLGSRPARRAQNIGARAVQLRRECCRFGVDRARYWLFLSGGAGSSSVLRSFLIVRSLARAVLSFFRFEPLLTLSWSCFFPLIAFFHLSRDFIFIAFVALRRGCVQGTEIRPHKMRSACLRVVRAVHRRPTGIPHRPPSGSIWRRPLSIGYGDFRHARSRRAPSSARLSADRWRGPWHNNSSRDHRVPKYRLARPDPCAPLSPRMCLGCRRNESVRPSRDLCRAIYQHRTMMNDAAAAVLR
jgi:hypothetical protein